MTPAPDPREPTRGLPPSGGILPFALLTQAVIYLDATTGEYLGVAYHAEL